jgi:hypothetical protein
MTAQTEHDRRRALDQALANTRIEGHVPSPEFLADCESYVQGGISTEDLRAASLARARDAQRAAEAAPGQVRDAA